MTQGRTQVSQDEDQRERETRIVDVGHGKDVTPPAPAEAVFRLDIQSEALRRTLTSQYHEHGTRSSRHASAACWSTSR